MMTLRRSQEKSRAKRLKIKVGRSFGTSAGVRCNVPLISASNMAFAECIKPVLDDAPWRAFKTLADYRAWCAANLPDYLGFKPAKR